MKNHDSQLQILRNDIDQIDQKILELLNQRAGLVEKVGEWKIANTKPIKDLNREKFIIDRIKQLNQGPLPEKIVADFFENLIKTFRTWEQDKSTISQSHEKFKIFPNKISIIGLGLIGYSIVLRLTQLNPNLKIVAYDPNLSSTFTLNNNVEMNDNIEAVLANEIVIFCTPVNSTIQYLRKYHDLLKKCSFVMDVSSTKEKIIDTVKGIPHFIGGHPLAGKAESGAQNACDSLFVGKTFIITTPTSSEALAKAKIFVELLGSKVIVLDSKYHDQVLALSSHLVQLLSTNLAITANQASKNWNEPFAYGPAFSDFIRLANSDYKMWEDIILTNKKNILQMLDLFTENLKYLRNKVELGNLEGEFSEARLFKVKKAS